MPQVVAGEASIEKSPLVEMPVMPSAALPELVSVTLRGALEVPTSCPEKTSDVGLSFTTGPKVVNETAFEVPPAGAGFHTVTFGVPGLFTSAAEMAARS